MEISETEKGNVNVIQLSGRLDASSSADVELQLNALIDAARVRLVINLEQLDYISSSGLRVLLATLKKVRKQEGDLMLACLKPYVKEVFDIAGFTQLFKIFDQEADAVDSYGQAS